MTLCKKWIAGLFLLLTALSPSAAIPAAGNPAPAGDPEICWLLLGEPGKKKITLSEFAGIQIWTGLEHPGTPGDIKNPPRYLTTESGGNPVTGAFGQVVVGPFEHCACLYHYHGTLFGKPDPDPEHCGWGCVVRCSAAAALVPALEPLSDAIMSEEDAREFILEGTDPDIEDAIDALEDSLDALSVLLPAPGPAAAAAKKGGKLKQFKKKIKKAGKADGKAIDLLEAFLESHNDADRVAARLQVEKALRFKREAIAVIFKPDDVDDAEEQ